MFIMLSVVVLFILTVYLLQIYQWKKGWDKIDGNTKMVDIPATGVSIVVCCRNEEKSLSVLLNALKNQSYKSFELILVDDCSSDATLAVMHQYCNDFQLCKVIQNTSSGKKAALRAGIAATSGKLILLTDADCLPGSQWVETMISCLLQKNADLLLGPVAFSTDGSCWQNLQQSEFCALVASGMAAAGNNQTLYGNAANLAFTRALWNEASGNLNDDFASGDDVFLIQFAKKNRKSICVCKDERAIVQTFPKNNLKEFFNQRRRWLSKSPGYTDAYLIFVTILIASINLLLVALLLLALFKPVYAYFAAVLFVSKLLADHAWLQYVRPFFNQKNKLMINLLLAVLYPAYVLITGILAFTGDRKKW